MADDFTCCGRCKNELQNVQLYLHFDKHDEKQFFNNSFCAMQVMSLSHCVENCGC